MACCCSLLALELSDNLEATELEVKTEGVAASAAEVAGSGAADSSGAAGSAGVAGAAGSSGSTAAADDKVAGGGVDAGEGVVLLLFRVIEDAVDMMAQTGSFE